MGPTVVTGATGFIGSHLARRLLERGDEVRLAVHPRAATTLVDRLECERSSCDVLDRRSVRRALKGARRVFHAAGLRSLRPVDAGRLFELNVGGTKTVLEECLRAGVERVVFTSSAATLGPAPRGETADEAQLFTAGHLGIPYVNSVHEAEVEALRLAAKGLPLVCVNPTLVLGPGDVYASSTALVRNFLLGRIPLYADGAINVVDVADVADGQLRADERGKVGERYILGGRNFTFDRLFADLGRLSGVEPPVKVPAGIALAAAALLQAGPGSPISSQEIRAASHWWTYRSTKAKRELGWAARPHEETLEVTVVWHLDRERDRIARTRRSQQIQYRVAGAALNAVNDVVRGASELYRRAAAVRP